MRGADWQPRFEDPEILEYLEEAAGPSGAELFGFILEREPVGSVDILEHYAERPASHVRKVLYRLMQAHALEYEKDTDAKGWETFTWRTDLAEIKIIHMRRWQDELSHLRVQVRFEKDHEFYSCENRHRRITFEDALDLEFQCPVCHDPMNPVDNGEVIAALETRVDELERALAQ